MKSIIKLCPPYLRFFSILVNVAAVTGCTETNNAVKPGDKPVIQAYLAPSQPVRLTVFTEIPYGGSEEGKSKPVTGLKITLKDSFNKTFLLIDRGNGTYESALNERVGTAGTGYTLEFEYNGRTVQAGTVIPEKPRGFKLSKNVVYRTKIDLSGGGFPSGNPFEENDDASVEATWTNPEKTNFFVAAVNITPNPEQIIRLPDDLELPSIRFTNEPVSGTGSILNGPSFEYFGNYRVVLYQVNEDYVALYQSGGTTSQNLSTPPSSIVNGLGIFTGINADTLYMEVRRK